MEDTEKGMIERGWMQDYADDGSRVHAEECASEVGVDRSTVASVLRREV